MANNRAYEYGRFSLSYQSNDGVLYSMPQTTVKIMKYPAGIVGFMDAAEANNIYPRFKNYLIEIGVLSHEDDFGYPDVKLNQNTVQYYKRMPIRVD